MKKCLLFLLLPLCFACNNRKQVPVANETQEIPEALQEDKKSDSRLFSKSYRQDLVEELFEEKTSGSPELKQLVKDVDASHSRLMDSLKAYETFTEKNNRFYQDANNHVDRINDSILKEKAARHLRNSQSAFHASLQPVAEKAAFLRKQDSLLGDQFGLLKILTALDMMKMYQQQMNPTEAPVQHAIEQIRDLIRKVDSAVVKTS